MKKDKDWKQYEEGVRRASSGKSKPASTFEFLSDRESSNRKQGYFETINMTEGRAFSQRVFLPLLPRFGRSSLMRKARWLAEWRKSAGKPVISRVVDRRFVLGTEEKEKFRTLMRMQENFTGCRVLSYCLMDNHFHLLLEVPPMADGGLSNEALLKRLSAIYNEAFVAGVAKELADARTAVYMNDGLLDEALEAIHKRFMTEGQSFMTEGQSFSQSLFLSSTSRPGSSSP